MSAKKSALGRSFESLIPTDVLDESFDPTAAQDERVSDLRHIKLSEIIADPDQPRRVFDELSLVELAESVKEHGLLQPIVVTPHEGGYMIVAGERRFRAAERVGLDKIPALVRTLSNQHKLEVSLIENLQRRDLNPLETATAYLKLRDQFNLTLDQIGQRVGGKSVAAISNTLRLLRLPAAVREAIVEGKLSEGQARPLISLDEDLVEKILPKILSEDWSARTIEQYAAQLKASGETKLTKPVQVNDHKYTQTVGFLTKQLNTPVRVKTNAKGSGQIVITFKNYKDLARIGKLLER
ncbi:MAG: ParB/RepB/Spo0J family partition protein [Candidatus Saccharimonas sp.]|nr:ParB/RepB/Spo0J family partition protein [Candidatus Saccharimonas sp.]